MRVDIWSDLVCPWCYVGKRRFERALARVPNTTELVVTYRSYLLYGSSPRGATFDRRDMLMGKYARSREQVDAMNAAMEATAAAEGLEYHLEGGRTGNTFDAHQVVALARDSGLQEVVLERLYRAFFTERRSIFDRVSLIALGVEAGLDRDALAQVFRDDGYAGAIEQDLHTGRALGVQGVPFFVFNGRYSVSGAQQPEVFVEAFSRAWSEGGQKPP